MKKAKLLMLACCYPLAAWTQTGDASFFNPLSSTRGGLHLYRVNLYAGYFSGGSPFGLDALPPTGINRNSNDPMAMTGGALSLGWSRSNDRSNVSVIYSPSYIAYPKHSELDAASHSFALNWNRRVGQKWSFNTSITGLVSNLQQSYFAPNALGLAASLPATFEGLAGAMLAGKFTDVQLASALTGAPLRGLPEQTYLFGRRTLSASVLTSASYTPSGRTSFHLSALATRTQRLNSDQQNTSAQVLIPQTTAGGVTFGWGYEWTSRTHIGIDAGTNRIFSRLQDGYSSTANFSIGRTMSPHWFVQGRAGAGRLTYLRRTISAPSNVQYTAGGSIGYKMLAHTLIASYDRSIGDSYGLGAGSTSSSNAGWAWKRPGSMWSASANFGYQQLNGPALLATAESWRASGGIARALNSHLFMSVQYAYFTFPSNLAAMAMGADSGVTMTLSWTPSQYR
jgi:hypothetical protein